MHEKPQQSSPYTLDSLGQLFSNAQQRLHDTLLNAQANPSDDPLAVNKILASCYDYEIRTESTHIWQNMLSTLVSYAPADEIAKTEVEQWFWTFIPPADGSGGQWDRGLVKAYYTTCHQTNPFHILGQQSLGRLQTAQDLDLYPDESDYRTRVLNALLEAQPYIGLEYYDISVLPFNPEFRHETEHVRVGDLYGRSRSTAAGQMGGIALSVPQICFADVIEGTSYEDQQGLSKQLFDSCSSFMTYNKIHEQQARALKHNAEKLYESPLVYLKEAVSEHTGDIELVEGC